MTVRVGVVGVGFGASVHVPAFRLVDGFDVVALCARSEESLQRASAATGIEDTSRDYKSFVQRDDLDLISIVTPVALHHPIALAALASGKHVLVEKPLASTSAECRDIIAAAASAGTLTATCFELRWTRQRSRIRSLVRDGAVGDPFWVRVSETTYYAHPSQTVHSMWLYDAAQGGGFLSNTLSHDIDFVCSLFGRPIAVFADVRTAVPRRSAPDGSPMVVTADDSSVVMLRFADGGVALLTMSAVALHHRGASFEAFGSHGSITGDVAARSTAEAVEVGTVNDSRFGQIAVDDRDPVSGRSLPDRGTTPLIRALALMLEDWRPAFVGGDPVMAIPSLGDGLFVQTVVEAARASSAAGAWVALDGTIG